jgi:hypothetical protein
MKIYIGPYKNWVGPYQIAKKLMFWSKDSDRVHEFGRWLSEDKNGNDSWIQKVCIWVERKRKRKVKIRIDHYDTWEMKTTLAMIALPMLKQLKESKHGSPEVEDKDVPKNLRRSAAPKTENSWDTDENFHKRWEWVMDEMIFAFKNLSDDSWDEQFYSGESDWEHVVYESDENGKPLLYKIVEGTNHSFKVDRKGMEAYFKRIKNGLRLFSKYYFGLWD